MNPVKHEQEGDSPTALQTELGPHGDGSHGAVLIGSPEKRLYFKNIKITIMVTVENFTIMLYE